MFLYHVSWSLKSQTGLTTKPPPPLECYCSVTITCTTVYNHMDGSTQASLSFCISWSLLKPMCSESVMLSNHLILCSPLLLPSVFPSIRVFSVGCHPVRWPKYWSFSFSISPSSDYSELISFRINWFHLFAVQGTVKSLF